MQIIFYQFIYKIKQFSQFRNRMINDYGLFAPKYQNKHANYQKQNSSNRYTLIRQRNKYQDHHRVKSSTTKLNNTYGFRTVANTNNVPRNHSKTNTKGMQCFTNTNGSFRRNCIIQQVPIQRIMNNTPIYYQNINSNNLITAPQSLRRLSGRVNLMPQNVYYNMNVAPNNSFNKNIGQNCFVGMELRKCASLNKFTQRSSGQENSHQYIRNNTTRINNYIRTNQFGNFTDRTINRTTNRTQDKQNLSGSIIDALNQNNIDYDIRKIR